MQPHILPSIRWMLAILATTMCIACTSVATKPPDIATTPAIPGSPAPQLRPTAVPIALTGDPVTKASIQATLDRYTKAWNEGDKTLLQSTIDPKSGPFRRVAIGRFQSYQESALHNTSDRFAFKLKKIEQRDFGFVRAEVESYGYSFSWTFREVDGRWLLSEPSNEQLGKRVTQESEHFTFSTYPWADDVNGQIMQLMEEARTTVVEKLGRAPEQKAQVMILPTIGSGPAMRDYVAAYYDRTAPDRGLDRIFVYVPNSFAYGGYNEQTGWGTGLRQLLTHEYTHLVNDRSFTPLYRLPKWITEGLAEYISESSRASEVRAAVERDAIIPLIDPAPARPTNPQDLQHWDLLTHDVGLAYAEGYSLVAYITETYDGLDGFWKLAQAYDKRQDLDRALQDAFSVSYSQFDHDWREWLAKY